MIEVIQNLPTSTIEFPLIKKHKSTMIARSMIAAMDDGSIIFAGNLNEGDEVQFGLGSQKAVNRCDISKSKHLQENNFQAILAYSCSARKQFLGHMLQECFSRLSSIAPLSGFFTYGEFFYSHDESSLLNITTTALFLNEKTTNKLDTNKPKIANQLQNLSTTEKATFHLIDYITNELEEREKQVTNAQQLADEYLNAINTTLIVSRTDLKGNITFANENFEKISGYKNSELIGQSHNIVRDPDNPSEFFKDMWDTIESGKIWQGNFSNIRRDGSKYFIKSFVIPIHDSYGDIKEYIAIREDITELVKAKTKAEVAEANQAAFLANMSHEIRTPMNGILGFSELMLETYLNPEQKNYVEIINNSASTLLNIINDILDFSKIKSQKIVYESIEIDLIKELKSSIVLLNTLADKKSIVYKKIFDPKIEECVKTDPTKLKQIIINLISNAIKFTHEKGEVEFKAEVIEKSDKKQKIRFSIKDTGIGIPKDKQTMIFSPFSQADDSTTREFGGTGLGLSISKTYVEGLGGELKLDSVENKGSTFYFDIELEICKHLNKKQDIESANLSKKEIIINRDISVLVAEDYEANRAFMKLVFSKYKIKPDFAHNGEEAVQKSQENSYDIIFMDINMPIMNGMDATKAIRDANDDTPIVALTANALDGDREKFLSVGMNDYLSKPLNQQDLQEKLLIYSKECGSVAKEETTDATDKELDRCEESILEGIKKHFANFSDAIMLKLISTFISSTEETLQNLKKAIDENNYKEIELDAHKIAGSAGNIRLTYMYDIAKSIEKDAKDQVQKDFTKEYEDIKTYFEKLKAEASKG